MAGELQPTIIENAFSIGENRLIISKHAEMTTLRDGDREIVLQPGVEVEVRPMGTDVWLRVRYHQLRAEFHWQETFIPILECTFEHTNKEEPRPEIIEIKMWGLKDNLRIPADQA